MFFKYVWVVERLSIRYYYAGLRCRKVCKRVRKTTTVSRRVSITTRNFFLRTNVYICGKKSRVEVTAAASVNIEWLRSTIPMATKGLINSKITRVGSRSGQTDESQGCEKNFKGDSACYFLSAIYRIKLWLVKKNCYKGVWKDSEGGRGRRGVARRHRSFHNRKKNGSVTKPKNGRAYNSTFK